jgi:hypothetical protein
MERTSAKYKEPSAEAFATQTFMSESKRNGDKIEQSEIAMERTSAKYKEQVSPCQNYL